MEQRDLHILMNLSHVDITQLLIMFAMSLQFENICSSSELQACCPGFPRLVVCFILVLFVFFIPRELVNTRL